MKYGGVIWTNHALDRLKERGIKIDHALTAFKYPESSRYAQSKDAWVYYRTWGNTRLEVVAKKNENEEWVILSVWSKTLKDSEWSKPLPWWKYVLREILGR